MHGVVVVVLNELGNGLRDSRCWGLGTRGSASYASGRNNGGDKVCSEVGQEVESAVYGKGEKRIEDWLGVEPDKGHDYRFKWN